MPNGLKLIDEIGVGLFELKRYKEWEPRAQEGLWANSARVWGLRVSSECKEEEPYHLLRHLNHM